jgi:hypothetical protein
VDFKERGNDMELKKKVDEAVLRMKKLELFDPIIKGFEKDQSLLEYSEPTPLGGILYWISNNPEWEKMIKEFEEKSNSLVYHVIHSYTEFGELLDLLFVSDDEDEWEYDLEDLDDGYAMSYCINLTDQMFSEYGTIAVKQVAGGLLRVG